MPRGRGRNAKPPFTPTTWTKTVNGTEYERTATSVDDEVRYQFDGWTPKGKSAGDAEKNAAAAAAATGAPTGARSNAGKPGGQSGNPAGSN